MDVVRKLRKRITDRLSQVRAAKREMDRPAGWKLLDAIKATEFVALKTLSELDTADDVADDNDPRLTFVQCAEMLRQHKCTTKVADLSAFVDRAAHEAFLMSPASDQATTQTSKTLRVDPNDGSGDKDTITVEEFAHLLLREVATAMNEAFEFGVREDRLLKWERDLTRLGIVTDRSVEMARKLARTKLLFKTVDKDGSGSITKTELYTALRRYKVPITKKDFHHILRVIDPDQSNSMSMEEWINFMMSTDDESDDKVANVIDKENKANGDKGTGLTTVVSEGVTLLAGNTAGQAFDAVVKKPLDTVLGNSGVASESEVATDTPVPAQKVTNPIDDAARIDVVTTE